MECPNCRKQFFGIGVCPECGSALLTHEQMHKHAWAAKRRRLHAARLAPEIRDSLIRLGFVFAFSCLILVAAIFIANSIAEKKLSMAKDKKMVKSQLPWQAMTPEQRRDEIKKRFKSVLHKIDDEFNH